MTTPTLFSTLLFRQSKQFPQGAQSHLCDTPGSKGGRVQCGSIEGPGHWGPNKLPATARKLERPGTPAASQPATHPDIPSRQSPELVGPFAPQLADAELVGGLAPGGRGKQPARGANSLMVRADSIKNHQQYACAKTYCWNLYAWTSLQNMWSSAAIHL